MLTLGVLAWGASAFAADGQESTESTQSQAAVVQTEPSAPEVAAVRSSDQGEAKDRANNDAKHRAEDDEDVEIVAEPEPCAPRVELPYSPGSSKPADDDVDRVGTIVEVAREWPDQKIVIEGYADATGSSTANLHLSHARASGVRDELVSQGIDADRLVVQAFGEFRPDISGDADRDRRVVVRVAGVTECEEREGMVEDDR